MNLVFEKSYFRYGNDFYLQLFGVAMENSISGFLSDIVMEDLEENVIPKLSFTLPYYKRYVDDIKTAIPNDMDAVILESSNKYHTRLQFTIEVEADNKLNFLDMTVKRLENGDLTIVWYQKKISSGRHLNFNGRNPIGHKRNVTIALADRAIAFTNSKDRPDSLKKVRYILKENGYPKKFVEKIIEQRVHRFYHNGGSKVEKPKKRYISAPYIPGLSERVKKVLNKHEMILSTKTTNKVQNIFTRTKYMIPKQNKSKLVYRVGCKNCNVVYVGESKQKIVNRMYRHQLDIRNKTTHGSLMLSKHAIELNHSFDFDMVEILEHTPYYYSRKDIW